MIDDLYDLHTFQPETAFDLGGYYATEVLHQIREGNYNNQIGFFGGDPNIIARINVESDHDTLFDFMTANEAQAFFGVLITKITETRESIPQSILRLEIFDYTENMFAVFSLPYYPESANHSFTIETPMILGLWVNGTEVDSVDNQNAELFAVMDFLVLQGAARNLEHNNVWIEHYTGEYLNEVMKGL